MVKKSKALIYANKAFKVKKEGNVSLTHKLGKKKNTVKKVKHIKDTPRRLKTKSNKTMERKEE